MIKMLTQNVNVNTDVTEAASRAASVNHINCFVCKEVFLFVTPGPQ